MSCDACEKGSYKDVDKNEKDVCRACPEGVKCDTPGKLESLELASGWYRPEFASREVYQCDSTSACVGGVGGDDTKPNYW